MTDRWRLHRGGIVNVWQYAEQTFDFSGGRAIFQGTNGSGKSRTLELLLPLCLDGDLRQLGSKGFDTVSIRRLMLDDYDGGPNRIGYAWVELKREGHTLTCGLGVKASKTSQQISDSWRFITPQRVGIDFQLAGPDRVPLGSAQLREVLGADCVLEEAAFRAKIAETVYGVPAVRYGDLLHLQRTLRNPDVGLKVLEGQLEQILSDALPPLDAAMIEQLATSFDDLESIRENITRLGTADKALRTFLKTYSDYALAGLRTSADKLKASEDNVRKLGSQSKKLTVELEKARAERAEAERAEQELEGGEQQAEETIGALKELPAFRDLQDLQSREKLVAASRSAASAALDVANKQRLAEDAAVDGVVRLLRRLAQDLDSAGEFGESLRTALQSAGLDTTLAPTLPRFAESESETITERVRAKPDPEAEPLPIERKVPPPVTGDELLTSLTEAAERAGRAAKEARQRSALTLALHQQALEQEKQEQHVETLRSSARAAQLEATEAAGRRNQANQELVTESDVWLEQVRSWSTAGPLTSAKPERQLQLPSVEDLPANPAQARELTTAARQWTAPLVQTARDVAHTASQRRTETRDAIDERDTELAALRAGKERSPATTVSRDSATGAAFYQLVDFKADLSEADRAGLESAMEASRLLNAWVTVEGSVPDLEDVLASPGDGVPGASLADVLVAVDVPDSSVPASRVTALLNGIGLGESSASMSLSVDGHWRAGTLHGRGSKPAAEFVGAGARAAGRQRRISELEEELASLRTELQAAEEQQRSANDVVAEWERHLEKFPGDEELIAKHTRMRTEQEATERANKHAQQLREEHDQMQNRWQATTADLLRQAGDAGLSPRSEDLRQAQQAAAEALGAAERLAEALRQRCRGTVEDLVDATHRYHTAVADRTTAESDADQRCAEYAAQAGTLSELTGSVGGEAKEIAARLAELESSRKQMRVSLKDIREKITALREQAAKLDAQLESATEQLASSEEIQANAYRQFSAVVEAPGVLSAALPELEDTDLAAVRAAVVEAADRKAAGETAVITKLQDLQTALAGGYDIAAEEHAGLLTVSVAGEEGGRPVAQAAKQVSTKLGEQRGFLDEQYQRIFADYLIRDLAEWLRGQITVAEDLARRMNEVLGQAKSSQGVHVQLEWKPSAALDDETRQALSLVRMPYGERTSAQDATLRRVFTERIEAERDTHSSGYAEILSRALDYRSWHAFTVRVADTGPDGGQRVRRLRQLSSGETRLVSYVTLFAAAAAFYDAVSSNSEDFNPLRLVLLDEAFERLDDPTIARMLGLLVDLDMDWVITWPSGWGVSDKIPRMHIYDVLRPRNGRGVACTQTTWDGSAMDRVDP
ncbi:TIGR02680 family protein [Kibdelosporangium philippinense]|uniref:TIGR02680 family protein n=1 Tax=Kibdelosporangium philippinense TaxID=211113 RepID=A0ABS8ZKN4_9PSEU|nr:TIGR02680 family protein [Kibdelosporangium philippinense]MCE7008356.1 TIGR02680 family protein [Kibdelosporangium philippinense]